MASGCRVIVPYLRGYGATRFLASDSLRSGQQAESRAALASTGTGRACRSWYRCAMSEAADLSPDTE